MLFFVPCTPVGKARPRVVRGHAFTPQKTRDCEAQIRAAFLQAAAEERLDHPKIERPRAIEVSLEIQMPIPKSWPEKRRLPALFGEIRPISRPDADNLAKTVLDALNGIAWDDDSQVCVLLVEKRYAETPGFSVLIRPYGED